MNETKIIYSERGQVWVSLPGRNYVWTGKKGDIEKLICRAQKYWEIIDKINSIISELKRKYPRNIISVEDFPNHRIKWDDAGTYICVWGNRKNKNAPPNKVLLSRKFVIPKGIKRIIRVNDTL